MDKKCDCCCEVTEDKELGLTYEEEEEDAGGDGDHMTAVSFSVLMDASIKVSDELDTLTDILNSCRQKLCELLLDDAPVNMDVFSFLKDNTEYFERRLDDAYANFFEIQRILTISNPLFGE